MRGHNEGLKMEGMRQDKRGTEERGEVGQREGERLGGRYRESEEQITENGEMCPTSNPDFLLGHHGPRR